MKNVVWSGFCLLAGILLFWMLNVISISIDNGLIDGLLEIVLITLAISLGAYGLISGFIGLKKDT